MTAASSVRQRCRGRYDVQCNSHIIRLYGPCAHHELGESVGVDPSGRVWASVDKRGGDRGTVSIHVLRARVCVLPLSAVPLHCETGGEPPAPNSAATRASYGRRSNAAAVTLHSRESLDDCAATAAAAPSAATAYFIAQSTVDVEDRCFDGLTASRSAEGEWAE